MDLKHDLDTLRFKKYVHTIMGYQREAPPVAAARTPKKSADGRRRFTLVLDLRDVCQ